ncbi:hypothetical protein BV20DRAFT_677533 [Pilatotrama ljubarskyi]|nr:hypothetical protein BV20DRAFT_677533 [Pilatotrama ljubarskyi]
MNSQYTDSTYQNLLSLYTHASEPPPEGDGAHPFLSDGVTHDNQHEQFVSHFALSQPSWPNDFPASPPIIHYPALAGRRLSQYQPPQPCISPYALSAGRDSDSETSFRQTASGDAPGEARGSSPDRDNEPAQPTGDSRTLCPSESTRPKRLREMSPGPTVDRKRGKLQDYEEPESMFESAGRMGGHRGRSTLPTGFVAITVPSLSPAPVPPSHRRGKTRKRRAPNGNARSGTHGGGASILRTTLLPKTTGQAIATSPSIELSTPAHVQATELAGYSFLPSRSSSAEVDGLLQAAIEDTSPTTPSSVPRTTFVTPATALPSPPPTIVDAALMPPSFVLPRRSGRRSAVAPVISDVDRSDAEDMPRASGASTNVASTGGDMYVIGGPGPRKAALKARVQIAAQTSAMSSRSSPRVSTATGSSSGKRRRAETSSDEERDFTADEEPPKKKRTRKSSGRRPRRGSGRLSELTYSRGSRKLTYSRAADYTRFACSKLYRDSVQCSFCDQEEVAPKDRRRVSRLPDTAYRHLRYRCEVFRTSDYRRILKMKLLRTKEAPVPCGAGDEENRTMEESGAKEGDVEVEDVKEEVATSATAEEIRLDELLCTEAVKNGMMVVRVPCLKSQEFTLRATAAGVKPEKVEHILTTYGTPYKLHSCTCCPYPLYSSYEPKEFLEDKTRALLEALEGEGEDKSEDNDEIDGQHEGEYESED